MINIKLILRICFILSVGVFWFFLMILAMGYIDYWYFMKGPADIPARVGSVPKTAVWWGGIDGGDWYDFNKTEFEDKIRITRYFDWTGDICSEGYYILRKVEIINGEETYKKAKLKYIDFKILPLGSHHKEGWHSLGAKYIDLPNGEFKKEYYYVLIPDGWIYGYFDNDKKHGKKSLYKDGEKTVDEQQF